MILTREELLMKLGAARAKARARRRLQLCAQSRQAAAGAAARGALPPARGRDPAQLWQFYIQLVEVKNLKDPALGRDSKKRCTEGTLRGPCGGGINLSKSLC